MFFGKSFDSGNKMNKWERDADFFWVDTSMLKIKGQQNINFEHTSYRFLHHFDSDSLSCLIH